MPLYDMKCKECHTTFDVLLKLKDIDNEMNCPKCNSTNVVKLISKGVNHKFNCGGFNEGYATNINRTGEQ